MKNLIMYAALVLFSFNANAKDLKTKKMWVSAIILETFKEKFGEGVEATWSTTKDDLYRADFDLNNDKLSAFFKSDGSLIATSRNITLDQLPLSLKMAVNEKLKEYTLLQTLEIAGENAGWFIEVVNSKHKIVWKGSADGSLTIFSKSKF